MQRDHAFQAEMGRFALERHRAAMRDGSHQRDRFGIEIKAEFTDAFEVEDLVGVQLNLGLCIGYAYSRAGARTELWFVTIRNPHYCRTLDEAQRVEREAHRDLNSKEKWRNPRRTPGHTYFDIEYFLYPGRGIENMLRSLSIEAPVPIRYGVSRYPAVYAYPDAG